MKRIAKLSKNGHGPEPIGYAVLDREGVPLYFDGRLLMRRGTQSANGRSLKADSLRGSVFVSVAAAKSAIAHDRDSCVASTRNGLGKVVIAEPIGYKIVPLYVKP